MTLGALSGRCETRDARAVKALKEALPFDGLV
jgi:hypothetical protein